MKFNRKQLIDYLTIISLRGLDSQGKTVSLIDDCVIQVTTIGMICYGVDKSDNIVFNHNLKYEIEDEEEDYEFDIVVDSIPNWIEYLKTLVGTHVDISEVEGEYVITSLKDLAYYTVPIVKKEAIISFNSCIEGPLIEMGDDRMEWARGGGDLSEEDYSEFIFDPKPFYSSIESGKKIDSMNSKLILSKKNVEIHIGDVKESLTPKFIRPKVDGVQCKNFVHKGKQEWSCMLGLHPITKVLGSIDNTEAPSFFYGRPDKNLVILTNESTLDEIDIDLLWAISSVSPDQGGDFK